MKIEFLTKVPRFVQIPDGKGHWLSSDGFGFRSERLEREIWLPEGCLNDLASIPRFARRLINVNGPHRFAAYVHDECYVQKGELLDGFVSRQEADLLFLDFMKIHKDYYLNHLQIEDIINLQKHPEVLAAMDSDEELVGKWTRNTMYKAVRAGRFIGVTRGYK